MKHNKIHILIADSQRIFREGLKIVLEASEKIEIRGEVANGKELISLVKQISPDIIITDIKMPMIDGIEATRKLCRSYPGARIIGLCGYCDDELIIEMLEAGAQGLLLKSVVHEELITAIESVYEYKPYFSEEITERLTKIIADKRHTRKSHQVIVLTAIERQIIGLICKEHTSKEIGEKLKIGKRTVETHRLRIMDKIGVKNVAGVVTYAMQTDLLKRL